MPIDESFSAGTKSGTPRRAHAPRIEPLSCLHPWASSARNAREERLLPASASANFETGEVGLPVLLLVDERVVEAVDVEVAQLLVVGLGMAVVVAAAAHLVVVLRDDRAGRDDDVDHVLLDQVDDHLPHAGGDERSRQAEHDRRTLPVAQHRLEDAGRLAERARLEGRVAVGVEQLRDGGALADLYRRRRAAEERLLPLAVDADRRGVDVLVGGVRGAFSFRSHRRGPPERMRYAAIAAA